MEKQLKKLQTASNLYKQMVIAFREDDFKTAHKIATKLSPKLTKLYKTYQPDYVCKICQQALR